MGVILLLKNSFGTLSENAAKTIGMIALVFLASFIFFLLNDTTTTLNKSNDTYFNEQNVYHFTILPALTEEEKSSKDIKKIYDSKMKKLAEENGFSYELQRTALHEFDQNDKEYVFLLMNPQSEINIPYVTQGRLPENKKEVTVSEQYAEANDIKIGDMFDVDDYFFIIVGFAYQPDFVRPIMDEEAPDVEPEVQSVVYMTPKALKKLDVDIRYNYSAKFNEGAYDHDKVMALRDKLKDDTQYVYSRNNKINRARTEFVHEQTKNLSAFSGVFLTFLFLIIIFSLGLILRKMISVDKPMLGQLKAVGYSDHEIASSYIPLAIIAGVAGGAAGYIAGHFGSILVIRYMTSSMIVLPVLSSVFSVQDLVLAVLVPVGVMSVICFLIALFMIRRPPLELIYESRSAKVGRLSKKVASLCKNRSFRTQLKFGLMAKSPLRLAGVFLIMLTISLMLMVGLIVSTMAKSSIEAMVKQVNYAYEVSFEDPVKYSKIETDFYKEPSISLRLYAKEGIKQNGQVINYDSLNNTDKTIDDFYVDTMALLPDSYLLKIHDSDGNLINPKLTGDNIAISGAVSQILKVGTGDQITFYDSKESDKIEKTYTVVAVSDDYAQCDIYAPLETIQNDFGFKDQVETLYTEGKFIDGDYDYVAVSGRSEMESFEQAAILPNVITVAFTVILSLISFVVLLILANILVDENRRNISILRALGYRKRSISYMVLDIYTPFIVIAYLLALPIGMALCRYFTGVLAKSTYTSFPVEISPILFAIGGVCLLLAYQFAILRTQKKITLIGWR